MELTDVARQAADRIVARGWHRGDWTSDDGAECAHQALRACRPQTGDGYIVSAALGALGYGPPWNDALDEAEGREEVLRLLKTVTVTDAELEEAFGSQWEAVVAVIRQAATVTVEQAEALARSRRPFRHAYRQAKRVAGGPGAAGEAAAHALGRVAPVEHAAARHFPRCAVVAVRAANHVGCGGLEQYHIDALLEPWREVVGDPFAALDGQDTG